MINPSPGQLVTELGRWRRRRSHLLDEINRIPLKSQSAFLEALQDRTITVGKETYDLPAFSFAIATMNPVELGQGTFRCRRRRRSVRGDGQHRLPAAGRRREARELRLQAGRLNPLLSKQRIIELRALINQQVFLHERPRQVHQRLVAATRPFNATPTGSSTRRRSLVERGVDLGASPRAIICWSRLAKCGRCCSEVAPKCFPKTSRTSRRSCSAIASGSARMPPRMD
jgi:MoxR-like ATPase